MPKPTVEIIAAQKKSTASLNDYNRRYDDLQKAQARSVAGLAKYERAVAKAKTKARKDLEKLQELLDQTGDE